MTRVLVFGLTDTIGGIETYVKNLTLSTDKNDIIFDFVVKGGGDTVFEDEILSFYHGKNHIHHITKMKINPVRCIKEMQRIYKAGRYDAVYVNTTTASDIIYVSRFMGKGSAKVIMHSHFAPDYNTLSNALFKRICNKSVDVKLACSLKAGKWLYGTEKDVIIINNGIETERFKFTEKKRAETRNRYGIGEEEFLIGHVGRLSPQKNQLFLIELLAVMLKKMKRMGNNINENNRIKYRNIRLLLGGVVQMRTCSAGG